MSQRKAVTKAKATAYARADRGRKTQILVELTGWHRDYARAALRDALTPRLVKPRTPRPPTYGPIEALTTCWAVLRAPAGNCPGVWRAYAYAARRAPRDQSRQQRSTASRVS